MLTSPKLEYALLLTFAVWLQSAAIEVPEGGNACKRQFKDDKCCGLHRYNPKLKQFCCGGIVADEPSGCTIKLPAYNTETHVCLYGQTVGRPTNCPPYNVMYFCCGGIVAKLPVNKCEPPEDYPDETCCGPLIYSMEFDMCCGNFIVPYSNEYRFPSGDECTQLPAFDPEHQECVGGRVDTFEFSSHCPGGMIHYCCGYLIRPK